MLHWHYSLYVWPLLVSVVATAALAVYTWHRRDQPGATPFAFTMAALTLWSASNALEILSPDLTSKRFWADLQYISYAFAPVGWLAMALQYTDRGRWLRWSRLLFLSLIPAITVSLVWTNDLHGLVRGEIHLVPGDLFPVIDEAHGPWFWAHVAYSYSLLLVGSSLLLKSLFRNPALHRGQTLVLLAAMLPPMICSTLYLSGICPFQQIDPSPLFFNLSGAIAAWGLLRWRLFDPVPVAQSQILRGLRDGVIVVDARGRIADLNPAAEGILGWPSAKAIGLEATQVLSAAPALADISPEPSAMAEFKMRLGEGHRYYEAQASFLSHRGGRPVGKVIVVRDITERLSSQAQQRERERALAALEERQRLARELHDGVAQALAYMSMEAEAIRKLYSDGQVVTADAYLTVLAGVARSALADVREYILGTRTASPDRGLIPSVQQHLKIYSQNHGLRTELEVGPDLEEGALEPLVQFQLQSIIQEALANVRKHAAASRVKVAFRRQDGQLLVEVEDDGRGFDPAIVFDPGGGRFGLTVMRERAEGIAGSVEVQSRPGLGTRVIIRVPASEKRAWVG